MTVASKQIFSNGNRPYDAEIEFLQSTGTQIIYTSTTTAGGFVEQDLELVSYPQVSEGMITGIYYSCISVRNQSTYRLFGSVGWSDCSIGQDRRIRLTFDSEGSRLYGFASGKNIIETDRKLIGTAGSEKLTDRFMLFGGFWNERGYLEYSNVKVRYFKMGADRDSLTLDMIPVRIGEVGYMYDKISGQLFGNAGTGNFILGPDKK